jgi:hypothetical protein
MSARSRSRAQAGAPPAVEAIIRVPQRTAIFFNDSTVFRRFKTFKTYPYVRSVSRSDLSMELP